jgi:hypothetical protein
MPSVPIISFANKIISSNSIEISRPNASSKGIVLGEILQTTILEKSADNKYTLALKNMQIPATSNISLNVGDKLLVKVDSLQPQIVLNPVENKTQNGSVIINEKLLQWRANPEALLQTINKLAGFAKLVQIVELPGAIPRSDAEKLIKLFDNIIFSPRTKNNPLFLKDFISSTGLLLENSLRQHVAGASKGKMEKNLDDNLKALLLKLSSAVGEVLRENSKLDDGIMSKLTRISAFTDEALKTIEVKQILNSVFQDTDNGLVLQVPVALADGYRLADIFITPDGKNGQGKSKFSSCFVAIFLDLDILGKIAVNAGFREGGVSCLIKCESEAVKDLINNNLDELRQSIAATGYLIGSIDCVQEEGIINEREEFLSRQSFFADQLVNFFV